MNPLRGVGIAVVAVALQTTLAPLGSVWHTTPDLLLTAVILLCVYGGGEAIFFLTALLGYLKDVYSGTVHGLSLLSFSLLAWLIMTEKKRLDFDSYLLDVTVILGTFLDGAIAFFVEQMISPWELNWFAALLRIGGRALYNVLLAETGRAIWKGFIEPRLAARPSRRRFREI